MKKLAFFISLLVISVNTKAQTWYVFDGVPEGKKFEKCKLNSSTPEKEIKRHEESRSNWTLDFSDEVKNSEGKVISLTMVKVIPDTWANKGGTSTTYWFRNKNDCIDARKKFVEEKLIEDSAYEEEVKKSLTPYH